MKHRVSITVDEETILDIKAAVRSGKFRNQSHAIEYAIKEVIKHDT